MLPRHRPRNHNKHHLAENNTGARNNSSYIIYTASCSVYRSQSATVTLNNFVRLLLFHLSLALVSSCIYFQFSLRVFFLYFIEFFSPQQNSPIHYAIANVYGTHKCISLQQRVPRVRNFLDILAVLEFQFHLKISNIIMHINRRLRPCFIFIECPVWRNSPSNRLPPRHIAIRCSLSGEPKTL
ncbi:unnamed protein product [Aphis gossypii]|uniref:Uncharacterized protein n=1 Tax=Aphis gossypii TaxID=80765 RepID=A0A9P0IXM0_APHGO|nr:unnamed protein product [Aphis gossypii]